MGVSGRQTFSEEGEQDGSGEWHSGSNGRSTDGRRAPRGGPGDAAAEQKAGAGSSREAGPARLPLKALQATPETLGLFHVQIGQ